MPRVLLTGGSGFIASHILDILLEHGHDVVTTVRSEDKAQKIRDAHPGVLPSRLDFRIVPDISQDGAFDEAVKIASLEAVIHTASPFHFNIVDTKKDLLDPAIIGTTCILSAIKKNAPSVKTVVITSSFAAIYDASKGNYVGHTYSEDDWNPITLESAYKDPASGYRASKTFAEKAAWEFVENERPRFTISSINPPLVFGPIKQFLNSLDALNTSNQRIRNLITGQWKDAIPDTGNFFFVDVRDVALAHVRAMERPEAAGKRFFVTAGHFSNKELVEVVRKNFPELKGIPSEHVAGGNYPEGGVYGFDNSRVQKVLGIQFKGLEKSVVDTVNSLKSVGI